MDEGPRLAAQRDVEGLTALLQRVCRQFQALGIGRRRPAAIGESERRTGSPEEAAVTLEDGLGITTLPAHHHLRIGRKQDGKPFLVAARRLEVGRKLGLALLPARALAHIDQRCRRGEGGQAHQDQRQTTGTHGVDGNRSQPFAVGHGRNGD